MQSHCLLASIVSLLAVSLIVPCAAFAAKEKFERTKPHVNVGTIGHVDHGTTQLVEAIAAVFGSKLKENSTVPSEIDVCTGGRIAFKPFINTTISDSSPGERQNRIYSPDDKTGKFILGGGSASRGAAQMDGAILVVSAADGPMPDETRQHVLLASQTGVPAIVVFINNVDQVDNEEQIEKLEIEILNLLAQNGYDSEETPIIRGSASGALEGSPEWVASIENLLAAIDDESIPFPQRPTDKPFLMPIEDVFSTSGVVTVVTGRIEQGIVHVGDTVDVVGGFPDNLPSIVREIRLPDGSVYISVDAAEADDKVQLVFEGLSPEAAAKGMVIAEPDTVHATKMAEMIIYNLSAEEGGANTPFHANYRPQFYLRTADVTGDVVLIESGEVVPGAIGQITVSFDQYVPLIPGWRIPICTPDTNQAHAIGVIRHE